MVIDAHSKRTGGNRLLPPYQLQPVGFRVFRSLLTQKSKNCPTRLPISNLDPIFGMGDRGNAFFFSP
jgi:hypothetical protein